MDQAVLDKCQELIGHEFADVELLSLALTHASVATSRVVSNERLEFLGDVVLSIVVCHELYNHPDRLREGQMTKIKSSVVSGRTCAEIARGMGLCELAMVGKGITKRGQMPVSMAGALLEAVLGAIYLDGGLEAAKDFILPSVRPYMDQLLGSEHESDYKSMLQQRLQQGGDERPDYQLLDEKGPDHSKCFEIAVSAGDRQFPSAWGRTKKEAEQEAARLALVEMGLLDRKDP